MNSPFSLTCKQLDEMLRQTMPEDIFEAHKHTVHNKKEIKNSQSCGCFSCLHIFNPGEITQWGYALPPKDFAVCPYCEIDSVIGDASDYPITDEFLKKMHEYWFS